MRTLEEVTDAMSWVDGFRTVFRLDGRDTSRLDVAMEALDVYRLRLMDRAALEPSNGSVPVRPPRRLFPQGRSRIT